jgi:hypothetical protein
MGYAGDTAHWKVIVSNCGDSDLINVIVTDSNGHNFGPAFNLSYGALPVEFNYDTTVNVDTTNTANVTAIDALGGTVSDSDSATNLVRGGATRTWGFWKTHLALVQWMYGQGMWSSIDMGTWNNATGTPQAHVIDSICRYMGLMWSDQSKNSDGKARYDIDVVRIHAAHQALAAITNSLMPGGAPLPGGMTPASIAATLSSNNITEIGNLASVLTDYNESGDLVPLDPSLQAHQGNANPTGARRAASANCYRYWDTPPKPRH